MKNKITYTQNDSVIVNTLKSAGKPLTLNELNELANSEIKPSQSRIIDLKLSVF